MTKSKRRFVHIRPGVFIEIGKPVLCDDGSRWRLRAIDDDDVAHWEPLDPGVDALTTPIPAQLRFRSELPPPARGKRGEAWHNR